MVLNEKSITVNRMMENIKDVESDKDHLRIKVKELSSCVEEVQKERDDALFQARDLHLQVEDTLLRS